MLSYPWRFYSGTMFAFRYFVYLGYCALGLLSRVFPAFIRYHPSGDDKPNDPEANYPADITSASNCDTYTMQLHPQRNIEIIGVGASAQVYAVDLEIVLKASTVFERPGSSAPEADRWHYASDSLFHFNLLQNERIVLRVLQERPHPQIMEAIDADEPEGIYLRRYHPLPSDKLPPQPHRIRWYRDITDALCHIHSLGIAHADLRIDNILMDEEGRAILCDFSAASPFGQSNPSFPDLPLPVNGPSPALSEVTDIFAMGSLIFHIEHQSKPELFVDSSGTLVLPKIRTDHQTLDTIIQKAWLGQYKHTAEMLEDLDRIDPSGAHPVPNIKSSTESTEALRYRVKQWRECRENKFGCVLDGILREEQLQHLAQDYGLDKDADLRFTGYQGL
ncbi:hypothetical protein BP00DRAFT_183351 [Aspergillus indologenus CBS 114.80]|uniref:Protein kinase domain-containing protein n=1 Tax=Aspergillus indologenus CBS 114.80 TaxID=1450541 RepID=A0A2V5IA61_9EURO|nr:hypothetical protein BP00DRAFT_183351 [Aspergillus indologenus CBS 114.80]